MLLCLSLFPLQPECWRQTQHLTRVYRWDSAWVTELQQLLSKPGLQKGKKSSENSALGGGKSLQVQGFSFNYQSKSCDTTPSISHPSGNKRSTLHHYPSFGVSTESPTPCLGKEKRKWGITGEREVIIRERENTVPSVPCSIILPFTEQPESLLAPQLWLYYINMVCCEISVW